MRQRKQVREAERLHWTLRKNSARRHRVVGDRRSHSSVLGQVSTDFTIHKKHARRGSRLSGRSLCGAFSRVLMKGRLSPAASLPQSSEHINACARSVWRGGWGGERCRCSCFYSPRTPITALGFESGTFDARTAARRAELELRSIG